MKYSLYRLRDGEGASGSISIAIGLNESNEKFEEDNAKPRVGVIMQVGSREDGFLRVWETSLITKVVDNRKDYVRFMTKNGSTYEWECFDE
jgi:hypothetical protein